MVNVQKIDRPKPKKLKLVFDTLFKRWYARGSAIIVLLVFFFPVGLLLMWKFTEWSKRTKWIVTGIWPLLIIVSIYGSYVSPPTITLSNLKGSKASTDEASYEVRGGISSLKTARITINDEAVDLSDDSKFSHKVALREGDNTFILVATNGNGITKEKAIIHRTTQAEFAARAEAKELEAEKKAKELRVDEDKRALVRAEQEAKVAKEKAEADTKAAVEAKKQAEAQAQHNAYIDGLATSYCSNHKGSRNIYVPQSTMRDEWENPNGKMVTKQPTHSNCVTIMAFFVDTMPSKYIDNIVNSKVGIDMNKAEVLAAWGWPNDNSNYSSAWGSSGTWTWDAGTCYYGVCPHQQFATFYNGKVTSTGNY